MNFTHAQISELLLEIANSENGTNLLIQMTLETSSRYIELETGMSIKKFI